MKRLDSTKGLVEFDIVTDLSSNLEAICKIALSWNSSISHYRIVPYDDQSVALYLFWSDCNGRNTALPFNLNTPKLVADFVLTWLSQNEHYPDDAWGGDGHNEKGIRITSKCNHNDIQTDSFYLVAACEPEWVYYGK